MHIGSATSASAACTERKIRDRVSFDLVVISNSSGHDAVRTEFRRCSHVNIKTLVTDLQRASQWSLADTESVCCFAVNETVPPSAKMFFFRSLDVLSYH